MLAVPKNGVLPAGFIPRHSLLGFATFKRVHSPHKVTVMPAKIVVKSGAAAKQVFPIEEELVRIGSDPTCELVLPDANLAPHAATLEFLDGNYIVYNRSDGI